MDAVSPRAILGEGTPEADWQDWLQRHPLRQADIADLVRPGAALHVVAPHPDDEILGCGGILRQAARQGSAIHVWAVTDGEASHPGSPDWPPARLAQERTRESERALQCLAVPAVRHRLAIPDGGIEPRQAQLAHRLAAALQPGDTLIAPWRLDGHPDHEAVARAGLHACADRGARFLEVPIWGWHWVDPAQGDFPVERAVCVPLDAADLAAKTQAIQAFRTQLLTDASTGQPPILPAFAIARLLRPFEVLLA